MGQRWPDCDPETAAWLEDTTRRLSGLLGLDHVGTYLHGSLASGSYYPPKSDVDLLFVSSGRLSVGRRVAFLKACVEVSENRPMVGGLECSVVTLQSVLEGTYPTPYEVHFGEELVATITAEQIDLEEDPTDSDLAAHFQAIQEFGVCLLGRPVQEVFGPVNRSHFMDSVERDLHWILEGENLLQSPFYGILNACRVLWVWSGHSRRLVPTKEEVGLWAESRLPPEIGPIVRQALTVYREAREVAPGDRRTGGRVWDREALLRFRDHLRTIRAGRDEV